MYRWGNRGYRQVIIMLIIDSDGMDHYTVLPELPPFLYSDNAGSACYPRLSVSHRLPPLNSCSGLANGIHEESVIHDVGFDFEDG